MQLDSALADHIVGHDLNGVFAPSADILAVQSIEKSFGGVRALRGVSLTASERAITGIIGPNGSGKTTLLHIIGGLVRPDSGRIFLNASDISKLPVRKRCRRGLVRTFQISRELGEMTVLENLLIAGTPPRLETAAGALLWRGRIKAEQAKAAAKAAQLLQKTGLWRLRDALARTLSGGQKKLLEIARALMLDPKVILLDEPAAGVSPPMRLEIAAVIQDLKGEGKAVVIVEHDMDVVARLCDRVYVIAEGANLTAGTFKEVVSDQRVIQAYLGGVV